MNPCPHCNGRGTVRNNKKLTDDQVRQMRAQLDSGEAFVKSHAMHWRPRNE